jgi:chemotaxis protein CheZ
MTAVAREDEEDLEALFDSIVAGSAQGGPAPLPPSSAQESQACGEPCAVMVNRLGQLTRSLHDSLRELGYDRDIEEAARAMPDTQDRLRYIASMTEQAAARTLEATEAAQPIQQQLGKTATVLSRDWDRLFAGESSVEEFKLLAQRTREFLRDVPGRTDATARHLQDIMLAQDFQDLTGQVIKKLMDVTQGIEGRLLTLLLDQLPAERKEQIEAKGLAGPVIRHEGDDAVVANQEQVDELLESLGF